jgi:hypothetical protein
MSVVTEKDKIDITVRILKVPEEEKYCVDFTRKDGDQLEFFTVFKNAKEFFSHFNDAGS